MHFILISPSATTRVSLERGQGRQVRNQPPSMCNCRTAQTRQHARPLPKTLSGGERQRTAVGRAIIRDPKLFLFDEPLSNLDFQLRNQMRGEIKALQKRLGKTMIYVTHDQTEAMTMADTLVVLEKGKIMQQGTPDEVYHRPANVFTARFIGSPPINILRGSVSGGQLRIESVATAICPVTVPMATT